MFNLMDFDFDAVNQETHEGFYIPPFSDCMRCGICVSSCPTFQLSQDQAESPRSRLQTIHKLLIENTLISAEERAHLDSCLQCRACETICPSKMAYGQLVNRAQEKLLHNSSFLGKLGLFFIAHKSWQTAAMWLLALYIKLGLQTFARRLNLLDKVGLNYVDNLLNSTPSLKKLDLIYPTKQHYRGDVALFTGCVESYFNKQSLFAAIKLLNAIGYTVKIPKEQGCCGAIHQHNGEVASDFIRHNIDVFNVLEVEAVIFVSSGCGVMLSEYKDENGQFTKRLLDIYDFLLTHWREDLFIRPLNKTVAVHEPCSARNGLKNTHGVYSLLRKIPELNIRELDNNALCCGAGGTYFLKYPENAEQLRLKKHQAINDLKVDIVVSNNVGCALFLQDLEHVINSPLEVLAELVSDQI